MDFVNQAIAQISDLFRSMTPGARITAGLLLAVVVVSVGYMFQHQSSGPDELLFGGVFLPDGQLNQIEAAIAQAGLSGFRREGNRIVVPAGQKAAYLAAVADGGALPPNFHTYLESALDSGGPWESSAATRERLKIARQQMLGEIIRAMGWVEDAVVLYDEQQKRGLTHDRQVTASVNVKPILGETLDPRRAKMLQKLVAHAVVGMKPSDVAVTSLGEGSGLGGDEGVFPEAFDDPYYRTLIAFEQSRKQSIENALRDIPGVRVEVRAELDDTVEESTEIIKPDPKSVATRETTKSDTTEQTLADGGGEPGLHAQGPGRQGTSKELSKENKSSTSSEQSEVNNIVGGETTRRERTGLTPKEVWATVTVPRSYIESVWKQRNPDIEKPPTDDDMRIVQEQVVKKIEDIVAPLLPRQVKGQDQWKQVQVVVLDSLPVPEIQPPSMASTALAWTGRYWSKVAMLAVTIFSLLVLRSIVKSVPPGGTTGSAAAVGPTLSVEPEAAPSAEDEESDEPERTRLRIKKGTTLKDDLAAMVKEDPDSAASILRSWIGKAG
jgi:flagellar M-ring protein FliF